MTDFMKTYKKALFINLNIIKCKDGVIFCKLCFDFLILFTPSGVEMTSDVSEAQKAFWK